MRLTRCSWITPEQDLTRPMHLWNDYEGATLAGQWKLGQLLRTEGRSALFATTAPSGKPAVLRLTEALNDQSVLHERYRAIQAAGDKFLVKVEGFGDAELDGTPLSYAVLEPTQESLAEILAGHRLDAAEMLEVAQIVAGGLKVLHEKGLVHGLVEPESVLAAGDRIKLRSDCARPAPSPEDAELEGALTVRTDAWGLAGIIHQSLTQKPLHDAADALALPEPYAAIVRNTARGAWGVPEVEAELARYSRTQTSVPAAPASSSKPVPPPRTVTPASLPAEPATPQPEPVRGSAVKSVTAGVAVAAGAAIATRLGPASPASAAAATPTKGGEHPSTQPLSSRAALANDPETLDSVPRRKSAGVSGSGRLLAGSAVAAAVLLLVLFLVFHHRSKNASRASQPEAATASSAAVPALPQEAAARQGTASKSSAAAPASAPVTASPAKPIGDAEAPPSATPSDGREVWRVVAYTYNRRAVAEHRAASLNRQHPNFKAEVWSRTGGRPFLVTLGGPMPKDQATEMRALARRAGVAPDVYAQNYSR